MAEIKNRVIISVIFYYGLGDTPLQCLTKKYVVTNWEDKSDLLRLLDQIAKELNYISGYGISLIKVKSDRFDFEHKVALQPYHSEVDNSATLNHFVFQKVLKFEVGRCKGRGGTVRLEVPRLWDGVANSWDLLEFNDRLLSIRVVPNSKSAKQKGIDYLTYFDQEDLVLLSFLKRISKDGGLEPFTKKVWEGNSLLVPSYGDIKLYNLPVTQTSYYKKKKGWAQEKKRLKVEENKRLKHERSSVIYKDQKIQKKQTKSISSK